MSVCTNSSTTFAAAWTLSSETMATATLDAASQTEATSMHQNGHIRVRWHQDERTLAACNRHRHTGPTPGMMDNARPYVAGIVRTFLDTGNVRLLPWPASSPDLSPIENVWSTVAERLARHHMPVTTVDELWYRVEAAWSSVPVHAFNLCLTQCPGL
ncbi:uncharacterized protein TNCV_4391181 [Trichonephila clavipes]|nr:uncharacterized protein TNCV_4391181 [Trichonephila clavipes]